MDCCHEVLLGRRRKTRQKCLILGFKDLHVNLEFYSQRKFVNCNQTGLLVLEYLSILLEY